MSEVVYVNLGELVKEARKKYGFDKKEKGNKYPIDHKRGSTFSTGFFKVFKIKSSNYKQGFNYQYRYYDDEGRQRNLSSVDIVKLRKRVKDKGLVWKVIDANKASKIAAYHKLDLDILR